MIGIVPNLDHRTVLKLQEAHGTRIRRSSTKVPRGARGNPTTWRYCALLAAAITLIGGVVLAWGPADLGTSLRAIGLALLVGGPLGLLSALALIPSEIEREARA